MALAKALKIEIQPITEADEDNRFGLAWKKERNMVDLEKKKANLSLVIWVNVITR